MFQAKESERGIFLEHVREARQERQIERKKEAAAIKIQSFVRGSLARIHQENIFRDSFRKILSIENATDLTKLPTALKIFRISARFFKIYKKHSDFEQLNIYLKYILSSILSDNINQSVVSCALNKEFTLRWIQHIKQVSVLVIESLSDLDLDSQKDQRLLPLYLTFLLTFSATSTWKVLLNDKFSALRPLLSKLTNNILLHMVNKGLYPVLQQVLLKGLCRSKPALNSTALTTIVTLTIRPLLSADDCEHTISLISIHLFSVPALVHHLNTQAPQALKMMQDNDLLSKVVSFIYEEQNSRIVFNTLEASYTICLLGNLVQLADIEKETTLSNFAYPSFVIVITRLLNKCKDYVSTKQSRLTQWHPLLGWFSQSLDSGLNHALPVVRTQLETLWSTPMLKLMFKPLFSLLEENSAESKEETDVSLLGQSPGGARGFFKRLSNFKNLSLESRNSKNQSKNYYKLNSTGVVKVSTIASMYYMSIVTISQLKMDVLNGICNCSNLIKNLWTLVLSIGSTHYNSIKAFLNLLTNQTKITDVQFHLLILLSEATIHLISVIDDVEMYEDQKPLTLDEYKNIASFCNVFIFRMISKDLIDVDRMAECPLFLSIQCLVTLLHRRCVRRPFMDDKDWYIVGRGAVDLISLGHPAEESLRGLLIQLPHCIPQSDRIKMFRTAINNQRVELGLVDGSSMSLHIPSLITVRRNSVLEDGYRKLSQLPPNSLKGVIRVKFVNEYGLDEAGIDQDGVFKEFLSEILTKLFDPSLNLFKLTSGEQLYPSPTSSLNENHLSLIEFAGKMLAKALTEGILVDFPFAYFFLSQLLGEQHSVLHSSIDDLPSLDPELYKNLTYVKHYKENVSDLGLTFSYDEEILGQLVTHELRPGGQRIQVTNENKILYIHLMAHFKLHTQIKDQTNAFLKGFKTVIQQDFLQIFSVPELQQLISGDFEKVDLNDLREHTHYYGGFHDKHRVIIWLWDILNKDFTLEEKKLFLKFVTSCSKGPLLGFSTLDPPFSIRCVEVNDDEDTGDTVGSVIRGFFGGFSVNRGISSGFSALRNRDKIHRLPTSSTCFNLLKLPNYQKKSTLREKLRYSIHSNTGFELS